VKHTGTHSSPSLDTRLVFFAKHSRLTEYHGSALAAMAKVLNVMVAFELIVSIPVFLNYKYNVVYSTNALYLIFYSS
jgi:hypothetical protein